MCLLPEESMALNHRQRRFAEEYIVDGNATRAAVRAGYAERSAHTTGGRLLKNDEVAALVRAGQERLAERTAISAERVMREYARMGFANMTAVARWGPAVPDGVEFHDSDGLAADDSAAVAQVASERSLHYKDGDLVGETVTLRVKLHDKKGALDAMAKRLGLFGGDGPGDEDDPLDELVEGWKEGMASDGESPAEGLPGAAP